MQGDNRNRIAGGGMAFYGIAWRGRSGVSADVARERWRGVDSDEGRIRASADGVCSS